MRRPSFAHQVIRSDQYDAIVAAVNARSGDLLLHTQDPISGDDLAGSGERARARRDARGTLIRPAPRGQAPGPPSGALPPGQGSQAKAEEHGRARRRP
jgi:hypothetical protein